MKVTLFVPCFIDHLYPRAGVAMVEVLERLGHQIEVPESVGCCGQPAFNSGYWEESRRMVRPILHALSESEVVVIGSGSCGAMLKKFYPELMAGTPEEEMAKELSKRVYEFSDFLVTKLGVVDVGARYSGKVTFHDGCHGLRELGIKKQPRELLKHVKGLELVEMDQAETCCGFGGTFAVKFPMISTAMGEVKGASILGTGVRTVVSNDSSCLMQIQGVLDKSHPHRIETRHIAEILANVGD